MPGRAGRAELNARVWFLLSAPSLDIPDKVRARCITKRDLGLVCGHHVGEDGLQRGHKGKPRGEVLRGSRFEGARGWEAGYIQQLTSALGWLAFSSLTSAPKAAVSSQPVTPFNLNKQTNSQHSAFICGKGFFSFLTQSK